MFSNKERNVLLVKFNNWQILKKIQKFLKQINKSII